MRSRKMENSYLIGLSEKLVPTPALVLDAEVFEKNMKTNKTPMIAHQQMKNGAIGLCCATIGEAEVMVNSGLDHILIANEVIGEDKIRRFVSLAHYADVIVAVDNAGNLADLSSAAAAINVRVGVLIEVDVGTVSYTHLTLPTKRIV